MSGMNVLKMIRPMAMMRSLQVSPQLHSQMAAVRRMSSQKEMQYIKVDTTGAFKPTSVNHLLIAIYLLQELMVVSDWSLSTVPRLSTPCALG